MFVLSSVWKSMMELPEPAIQRGHQKLGYEGMLVWWYSTVGWCVEKCWRVQRCNFLQLSECHWACRCYRILHCPLHHPSIELCVQALSRIAQSTEKKPKWTLSRLSLQHYCQGHYRVCWKIHLISRRTHLRLLLPQQLEEVLMHFLPSAGNSIRAVCIQSKKS